MTRKQLAIPEAKSAVPPGGAFAALHYRVFATLWVATVLGNIGTFMRDVASGWLVAELSNTLSTVAMVQAASALPVFLLTIPAGALTDIVDRRKLLIAVQVFLAGVSATLTFMAATKQITVTFLVALTLLGGVGAALIGPTWQSIVPELVPRNELKGAIALWYRNALWQYDFANAQFSGSNWRPVDERQPDRQGGQRVCQHRDPARRPGNHDHQLPYDTASPWHDHCRLTVFRKAANGHEQHEGGSPYGASTITAGDGSHMPSENELAMARFQGRHVAQSAKKQAAK